MSALVCERGQRRPAGYDSFGEYRAGWRSVDDRRIAAHVTSFRAVIDLFHRMRRVMNATSMSAVVGGAKMIRANIR
jgi:hypothetical protein